MPAHSEIQQQAAGAALAAKRGKIPASKLYGASKQMLKGMSGNELKKFAGTPHKGLPHSKSCMSMEAAGQAIVNDLLENDEAGGNEEQAEVNSARSILTALERLQSSIPNATPEQKHDITTIRASANAIIRMHQTAGPSSPGFFDKDFYRTFFSGLDPSK